MDYLTPAAVVWVILFIILGLARGFWKALAALVSLIGAYFASAYFAPKLSAFFLKVFASANLGETVTWMASATLIFILAGLVIRLAIVLIARSAPVTNRSLDAIGGALVSGTYGALMALVMVWGFALLLDTYQAQQAKRNPELAQVDSVRPAIVIWSRRLMADAVSWNARQSGATDETAQLMAAYARQPQDVLSAVQDSVGSDAFRQIVSSENVQRIVRERDVEALQKSPEFTQLMQQPNVQKLRTIISPDGSGWSEEAVARQMVEVWGGVDELKNNPEITLLIEDPEVQAFLQGGGNITPSLLAKGQQLLRVLAAGSDQAISPSELPELYQWQDEDGQLQVTEYEDIPADKQSQAIKIAL